MIKDLGRLVGSPDKDYAKWVRETQQHLKAIERDYENTLSVLAKERSLILLHEMYYKKSHFLIVKLSGFGQKGMRMIADYIREREKEVIGFIYEENVGQKIDYVVFVGDGYKKTHPAHALIKEVNAILGGGGGGRPHIAEGGGGALQQVSHVREFLVNTLKS